MNIDTDTSRQEKRLCYWEHKHQQPDWPKDIHFALLAGECKSLEDFQRGIATNTNQVFQDILERASLYRLSKDPLILDFACGSGDLLIALASELKDLQVVGIDIASTAIETARNSAALARIDSRIRLRVGGIERMGELLSEYQARFDVIVCRDAYYLLDKQEQSDFLSFSKDLLREGGLLYIADLCVRQDCLSEISELIIKRQHGGNPIVWTSIENGKRVFDLVEDARRNGLELVHNFPKSSEWAVRDSYRAASEIASSERIKRTFQDLANLCELQSSNKMSRVPYVRFFFQRAMTSVMNANKESVGVVLQQPYKPDGKKELLRAGQWLVPKRNWSLVLGRSGAGKSTFLNMVSGRTKPKKGRTVNDASNLFYLSQQPALISELTVTDNIALFAKSQDVLSRVCASLGLAGEIRTRRADNELSGGERQRTALAQAIAAEPDILLLDEPCAGVDRIRKGNFFSSLHESLHSLPPADQRPTVICVDHEFLMIEEFFDYIYEILDGRLVCLKAPSPTSL